MIGKATATTFWRGLPRTIRGFTACYLTFIIFAVANSYLMFEAHRAELVGKMYFDELPGDAPVHAMIAFRAAFTLGILVWALWRQSLLARLIIIFQLAASLYGCITAISYFLAGNWKPVPFLIGGLFCLAAVAFMLTSQSREWFARKGRTLANDVEDFR